MKTLVLLADDLRALVAAAGLDSLVEQTIARLREGLLQARSGAFEAPKRAGFHYQRPTLGLLEWMPGKDDEATTVKLVGYHPHNPAASLPTILSVIAKFDTATGHLAALSDGTFLTAVRTGAASAIATDALAREQSRVLGLIGCGAQAVAQLHALSRVRPIDTVLLYDRDKRVEGSFAARVESLGLEVELRRAEPRAMLELCDVICTCTSIEPGQGPVLELAEHRPWLHVNAIGSDFPGKTEIPREMLESAFLCADFPEQCLLEGECQQVEPGRIDVDLAELASEPARFHGRREEPTVFDSTGWSLEDHFALDVLVKEAQRLGLGTLMEIETCSQQDPHDPYAFLREGEPARRSSPAVSGERR